MNRLNLLIALLFSLLFVSSFMTAGDTGLYLNSIGLLIVVSGTICATFLSYPLEDIRTSLQVARNSYTTQPPTASEIVNALLSLAVRSRHDGILALENQEDQTTVSFLRSALEMLVDGYREDELTDILATEMYYFQQRRSQQERVFRHMARLAPAFGVAGSVIGLVGMLSGIGDPAVIVQTIPIALTSTLYGILFSNFVFTPVAESINAKTQKELLMQKLVVDGVIAIYREHNTHKLAKKLESFLTPAVRPENARSFDEIRERYRSTRARGELADTRDRATSTAMEPVNTT